MASYTQTRGFDTSKGGTVPNMCLDNVRKGFSINNKYGSAWIAWQHTQQHPDRNIPAGVDVPLYYSYTTSIDGITENYGHINVRLKNGTVWSDGKIYASIDDYTAYHYPKYVGWGESINDYTIIEQGVEDMPITPTQVDKVIKMGLHRAANNAELNNPEKQTNPGKLIDEVWASGGEQEYNDSQNPAPTPGATKLNKGSYYVE